MSTLPLPGFEPAIPDDVEFVRRARDAFAATGKPRKVWRKWTEKRLTALFRAVWRERTRLRDEPLVEYAWDRLHD